MTEFRDEPTCTPEAFREALAYLYDEAMAAGWQLPAHFIGVAAEAMRAYSDGESSDISDDGRRKSAVIISFGAWLDQTRKDHNPAIPQEKKR